MKRLARVSAAVVLLLATPAVAADTFDYRLNPAKIADGTYVLIGKTEDFTFDNGGNVVNAGFIVTSQGVVVIDTGPSRRYGEQMRAAIGRITDKPIVRVFNSHHHPDHFLGNQAFDRTTLAALPATISSAKTDGGAFTDNLYRMSGDWMAGTEPVAAQQPVTEGKLSLGGHDIRLLPFSGHTGGDLAVFDKTTGVLFTGDLVFFNRSATTPHANLDAWFSALDALQATEFKILVPGHGGVTRDMCAIQQTRAYLRWLQRTLIRAARQGLDMTEVLQTPIPEQFESISLVTAEFRRSLSHLYPQIERSVFEA